MSLQQRVAIRLFGKLQSPLTTAEASHHPSPYAYSGDTDKESGDADSTHIVNTFLAGRSDQQGRLNRFERT